MMFLFIHLLLSSFTNPCHYFIDSDSYSIDPSHTYIGWDVERFMVGEVTGQFDTYKAEINIDATDINTLQFKIIIDASSINSGHEVRDGHLRSDIWLDVEKYPEIIFESTSVSHLHGNTYDVKGDFTIHGVTNRVSFPAIIQGPFKDPTQKLSIGLKADFTIDRMDYGIAFSKKMDNGSFFIGKDVKIKIRALAYKSEE